MTARARWRRFAGVAFAVVVLVYLGYGLAHRIYNRAGPEDLTLSADFESGDLDVWRDKGAIHVCCDDSIVLVDAPVRSGTKAARFTLRRDDADVKGSRRAEVRMKAGRIGDEYRYAFSLFLPTDWRDEQVPATLAQWHAVPDKWLAEAGRSPPLRLMTMDGKWLLAVIWDSKRVSRRPFSDNDPEGWLLEELGPLDKGRWVDWSFTVRWSYRDGGRLTVTKDGRRVFERDGPNAYNDALGPYLKLGIYVPEWAMDGTATAVDRHVVYLDDVSVQPASLP